MIELNFRRLSTTTSPSHSLLPFTKRRRNKNQNPPPFTIRMELSRSKTRKDKVIVILGATGAGKSKLSIDLASRYPSEIINSDKIQVYEGLEITTNQITLQDRNNIPHHLLSYIKHQEKDLTAEEFRLDASNAISDVISRGKLPIIAGGSNSYVHALLTEHYDVNNDAFGSLGYISKSLRYDCCFIWVDVSENVLFEYLMKRVDEMMDSGMFEELSRFYDPVKVNRVGLRKAIGVPEFDEYFKMFPPEKGVWDKTAYDKAVYDIKENTLRLAERQVRKIERLRSEGWEIKRVNATTSFKEVLMMGSSSRRRREIWEEEVLEPSVKIVNRFLVKD